MSSKLAASSAIFIALLAAPLAVRAEPAASAALAPASADAVAQSPRRWYGWETLVVDGAALGLGIAGAQVARDHTALGVSLAGTGVLGYTLVAPAVHWAHDRPHTALLSLAVRAGLPLVTGGLVVGAEAGRCAASGEPEHERFCDRMNEALLVTMTVSAIVASGFDAAVLGWAPPREAPPRLALTPLLSVDGRGGAFAGLGGAF